MIVCSCHGITDRDLRRDIAADRADRCLAGTGCGNCLPLVEEITRTLASEEQPQDGPAPAANGPHARMVPGRPVTS